MGSATLHGVEANPEFEEFTPIFRQWAAWIDDYAERVPEDVPYGDGRERALVGFIHAAALAHGWQGLQEFSQAKTDDAGDKTGRADLWLYAPDGRSFYFEAKPSWSPIDAEERTKSTEDCLQKAIEDAKKVKAYPNEKPTRIGLAFVTMRGAPDSTEAIERAIEDFGALLAKDRPRLAAWVFPASKRGRDNQLGVLALAEMLEGAGPWIEE